MILLRFLAASAVFWGLSPYFTTPAWARTEVDENGAYLCARRP